jgi:hypothetical protein
VITHQGKQVELAPGETTTCAIHRS